jgi:hypothetical protein
MYSYLCWDVPVTVSSKAGNRNFLLINKYIQRTEDLVKAAKHRNTRYENSGKYGVKKFYVPLPYVMHFADSYKISKRTCFPALYIYAGG